MNKKKQFKKEVDGNSYTLFFDKVQNTLSRY